LRAAFAAAVPRAVDALPSTIKRRNPSILDFIAKGTKEGSADFVRVTDCIET
jgi:hypothetical protein